MRRIEWKNKTLAALFGMMAALMIGLMFAPGLEARAEGRPVAISSCLISGDQVVCNLQASAVPGSDDGMYYIYADEVWQDGPAGQIAAKVPVAAGTSASFALNRGNAGSNLCRKFLVCVKQGGRMVQVSDEHYITNPEAAAPYTTAPVRGGLKGILPDPNRLLTGELQDLGIQHVVYNIYLDDICSSAAVPGAIPYAHDGQTYYFDPVKIGYYDGLFNTFNHYGMEVTIVLLNTGRGFGSDLVHPLARGTSASGYALNVAEAGGTNHLKAIASFLGSRYSGALGCGHVDNWILGNEINARTSWWHMNSSNLDVNVGAYVKAFRIVYNEMKAMNANFMLYNSLDQEWNRKSNPGSFLSREYLDRFNYYINREGNIDWGLSFHPYNSPLYDSKAWYGHDVWVKTNLATPYMTMQNIDLLIGYMHQPHFLNPYGQVRSISIAEIGYTSSFGTADQEASVAYGYLKAAACPDIDAFLLYRQTDNAHEMQSHLALGLQDQAGNHKPAYEIYKKLGTPAEAQAKARASEIIGMDIDTMISQNIIWTRGGDGVVH